MKRAIDNSAAGQPIFRLGAIFFQPGADEGPNRYRWKVEWLGAGQERPVAWAVVILLGGRIDAKYTVNIDASGGEPGMMHQVPLEHSRGWAEFKRQIDLSHGRFDSENDTRCNVQAVPLFHSA